MEELLVKEEGVDQGTRKSMQVTEMVDAARSVRGCDPKVHPIHLFLSSERLSSPLTGVLGLHRIGLSTFASQMYISPFVVRTAAWQFKLVLDETSTRGLSKNSSCIGLIDKQLGVSGVSTSAVWIVKNDRLERERAESQSKAIDETLLVYE